MKTNIDRNEYEFRIGISIILVLGGFFIYQFFWSKLIHLWEFYYSHNRTLVYLIGAFILYVLVVFVIPAIVRRVKRKKINHKLKEVGIKNSFFIGTNDRNPFTTIYQFKSKGDGQSLLERKKDSLEMIFGKEISEIKSDPNKKIIQLLSPKVRIPAEVKFDHFYQSEDATHKVGIGQSERQKVLLSLKEMIHLVVAGETGGGKSTFLRNFITRIILGNNKTKLYLVDLKNGTEFSVFENCRNTKVIFNIQEVLGTLEDINFDLDKRLSQLKEAGCVEIDELKEKIPRIVLIIDEAAEIFDASPFKEQKEMFEKIKYYINRISRLSRAAGIHLVIATQLPSARVLDQQTRINMVSKLAFRMESDAASISVLGNGKATDIPNIPGRALWKSTNKEVLLQVPYLSRKECENYLQPYKNINNPDPEPDTGNKGQTVFG